ncbi:MAG: Ltp family lipoprotein [Acidimicrobiales bacterium]
MRRFIGAALALALVGCGASGGRSAQNEPSSSTARAKVTTTTAPTTTTTIAKLQALQEMGAEIERACAASVASGTDPSIRYNISWRPYGSPDEVLQRARQCTDARRAAIENKRRQEEERRRQEEEQRRAEEEAARGTVSQQNAKAMAQDYLNSSAFSRTGLISQLEYEGFSNGDAVWAVDGLNVDWNQQAARMAADYLDSSAFSRSGLVQQLVYEGFTQAQAEYGVSTTGL